MPTLKRKKTNYPGVFYIDGTSPATGKPEKIFYIRYRKGGKMIEEKAGRQFQDDMTAARAARLRGVSGWKGKAFPAGGQGATGSQRRSSGDRWTVDRSLGRI